jgi:hypothetical protein
MPKKKLNPFFKPDKHLQHGLPQAPLRRHRRFIRAGGALRHEQLSPKR